MVHWASPNPAVWHQARWVDLNRMWRKTDVWIRHHADVARVALLRDQSPLGDPAKLQANCLPPDVSGKDWIQILNARVFLFPSRARAEAFRAKYGLKLLALHMSRIPTPLSVKLDVSPINGGARNGNAARSRSTYASLRDYVGRPGSVKEITVEGAITSEEIACCGEFLG